ncbi:cysteine-rich secretory protein 3-like isoform 2-T3 [Glossophaga mutica]
MALVLLFLAAVFLPFFPANGQDPNVDALSTTQKEVQSEILKKHNNLRRAVSPSASNMLKMTWDSKAAANAQKWANVCSHKHSKQQSRAIGEKNCGENLFMSSSPTLWSDAIQTWFDEKDDFTYGVGPKDPTAVIGHYTQLVWYSSSLIGCGIAYCPNQRRLKYYYVCHYCSAGNVISRKYTPYLQGTPCASCPNHCDNGLCTNTCKYEDGFSNCQDLKNKMSCKNSLIKNNCKASCNCSDKIY